MNREHLLTFLWLRWRIRVNQVRRGGAANAILLAILSGGAVLLAFGLFISFFFIGALALREAEPVVLLYLWDGLVVAFLFWWSIGLLTELQRSEALSLEKFLHLPVSLTGAFLINYLSSLMSLTLLIFLPVMLALVLGMVFSQGVQMLLLLFPLGAFLLAVTAITYQFQSWLAALMVNQRRRRTVIVCVTATIILLAQLPNLFNILRPWGRQSSNGPQFTANLEYAELDLAMREGKITEEEYRKGLSEALRRQQERDKQRKAQAADDRQESWNRTAATARTVNMVVPLGWLPLGAMDLAQGQVLAALLGTLGLGLIGTGSLYRAYRTTLRLYTGVYSSGKAAPTEKPTASPLPPQVEGTPTARPTTPEFLEKEIPWISEHAAAVALTGLRSLLRAPEAKMLLLTPLIMVLIFGGLLISKVSQPPLAIRPLMAFGAMTMILFSLIQLVGNQFGFDRSGFRVYVLCPAPRREILLGKNLAIAPLAFGMIFVLVIVLQVLYPMAISHFLATIPQAISLYLIFSTLANFLSILAPMPIAAGSLKPANPRFVQVLLHMLFFFLFPAALGPTMIPYAIEFALESLEVIQGVPIHLLFSLLLCGATVFLYRLTLTWQGSLLQAREQKILEQVASKAE